jgi:hypothetical protein
MTSYVLGQGQRVMRILDPHPTAEARAPVASILSMVAASSLGGGRQRNGC